MFELCVRVWCMCKVCMCVVYVCGDLMKIIVLFCRTQLLTILLLESPEEPPVFCAPPGPFKKKISPERNQKYVELKVNKNLPKFLASTEVDSPRQKVWAGLLMLSCFFFWAIHGAKKK